MAENRSKSAGLRPGILKQRAQQAQFDQEGPFVGFDLARAAMNMNPAQEFPQYPQPQYPPAPQAPESFFDSPGPQIPMPAPSPTRAQDSFERPSAMGARLKAEARDEKRMAEFATPNVGADLVQRVMAMDPKQAKSDGTPHRFEKTERGPFGANRPETEAPGIAMLRSMGGPVSQETAEMFGKKKAPRSPEVQKPVQAFRSPEPENIPPFLAQIYSNLNRMAIPEEKIQQAIAENEKINPKSVVPENAKAKIGAAIGKAPASESSGGGVSGGVSGRSGARGLVRVGHNVGDFEPMSLEEQFDQAYRNSLNVRKQSAEAKAKELAELKRPEGFAVTDLSPLMAYAAAQSGNNAILAGYKAPTAVEEYKQSKQRLGQEVEKGQQAIADDMLGYFKMRIDEKKAHEANQLRSDLALAKMEAAAAKGGNGLRDMKTIFDMEKDMTNSWTNDFTTKSTKEVSGAWHKISHMLSGKAAIDDVALVTALNKMLDPGSVVREAEFKNAKEARGLLQAWAPQQLWANKSSGVFLDKKQRAQFARLAKSMYDEQLADQRKYDGAVRQRASMYPGVNPDRVMAEAVRFYQGGGAQAAGPAPAVAQNPRVQQAVQFVRSAQNPNDPDVIRVKAELAKLGIQ